MSDILWISDNCYVDMEKRIVYKDDLEVDLTGRELAILFYFIQNKGSSLSSRQIEAYLDGKGWYGDPKNPIASIRKKIGDTEKIILETKVGVGYRLNVKEDSKGVIKEEKDLYQGGFGNSFTTDATSLIQSWESHHSHRIEKELLARCSVCGEEYENIYDFISNIMSRPEEHNYIIMAVGGSGKSSSLIYTCKKIMDDDQSIIPIFIEMRRIDSSVPNPLSTYLYNAFVHDIDMANPSEKINRFMHSLKEYLIASGKRLMIVLDGCNENTAEAMNDSDIIFSMPNTVVIASSRIKDDVMGDFVNVNLYSLDRGTVEKYLNKQNIYVEYNYNWERISLPFIIDKYVKLCNNNNLPYNDSKLFNHSTIINEWIKQDLNDKKKVRDVVKRDAEFAVNILLPLFAMMIYFNGEVSEHRSLFIRSSSRMMALKRVIELFSDEELAINILDIGIDIAEYDYRKAVKILNNLVGLKFGFIQVEEKDDYVYSWTHECYRDWFIAKGLHVLYRYSRKLSDIYIEKFIKETFDFHTAIEKNKDYPSYYVAIYYSELLGSTLFMTDDVKYHMLIQNIIFTADVIGDHIKVIEYADYLIKSDENSGMNVSPYARANALSGTAYSLLHIYNLKERSDREQLMNKALQMLNKAKSNVESILGSSASFHRVYDENMLLLMPEQIWNYFEKIYPVIENEIHVSNKSLTNEEVELTLTLYSKIFGNFGAFYLVNFYITEDRGMLLSAHRMHLLGALIKYYLFKNYKNEKTERDMAVSYKSIGVDLYRDGRFQESVQYLEYAKSHFKVSESEKKILIANIVRSKVSLLRSEYSEESVTEIIDEEKESIKYFIETRKIGELERATTVVIELISICNSHAVSSEIKNSLIGIARLIDTGFNKLSLDGYMVENMV